MTESDKAPEAVPAAAEPILSIEQQLLEAAAAGDLDEVTRLVSLEADVDYQDEGGVSPLMKAAEGGHTAVLAALLQAGAPWNAQDASGYCAGEYAMGSGQQEAVDLLLDFAVQAELVLGALHRRMQVGSPSSSAAANSDYLSQKLVYRGEQLLDADGEAVMMGWERPLMLRHAELICPNARNKHEAAEAAAEEATVAQARTEAASQAAEAAQAVAAMAVTEAAKAEAGPSSQAAAAAAAGGKRRKGGHVVNVGFGLGIVDTAIQSHRPDRHTIIEAHPDVLEHMARTGWADKPNVRILRGRWQDVLPELLAEAPYDGIFFDTYGEYYEEMREFHMHLPRLLARDGVYSFFNGLASDNIFFHMVYCRLISLELAAKGLQTEYMPMAVSELGDEVWQGVRNKYWQFETYFLPEVRHEAPLESVAEEGEEGEGDGEA
ncbi:hypothetical protein HYH02_013580 [Chlamydomonas schloesseri]|uniref:Protein arginine N-methyltransferase 2 n=1 Tax=Chlamydomonas schloesseri TaxID=2026947 RepID=A0A835SRY8_9CHLO|nr:hypothetical protein HYH02_013580 [Chlamydomonas schloesseri]|eukprot:KAG2430741.1 hypothetical protein HYH02_013580 [Chlamydomonas schloesseri]